jgi:TatD DNase family protein
MELIDTHCHLTFEPLVDDVEAVLQRSKSAAVTGWITVGTDIEDSKKAIALSERFDNVYAAAGIHPHEAKTVTDEMTVQLKQIARHPKVVAIGETGLDFHYNHSLEADQCRVFGRHLEIAQQLKLPVIIHSRKAFEKTLEILEQSNAPFEKVVFHCFSGSAEQAGVILDKGCFLSFTGVVTFKNAEKTRKAASVVPLDRLMVETDCPYMSPEPVRKQKVNEPALMVHTARFLAELRKMEFERFAEQVTQNSKNFFDIP